MLVLIDFPPWLGLLVRLNPNFYPFNLIDWWKPEETAWLEEHPLCPCSAAGPDLGNPSVRNHHQHQHQHQHQVYICYHLACIDNQLFLSTACPLVPVGAVGQHLIPDHGKENSEDNDNDNDDAGGEGVPGQGSLLNTISLYAVQLCLPLPRPVTSKACNKLTLSRGDTL